MTSIICPFELAHLNDLLFDEWVNHIVKELNVKEALKSSIFVVQKAAAPKSVVEFRQGSNGTIRSSLATSYDVWRRRATSLLLWSENWPLTNARTHPPTHIAIHWAPADLKIMVKKNVGSKYASLQKPNEI